MNMDSSLTQVAEVLMRLELSTIHIELRTKLRAVILDTVGTFVADKVDARAAQSAESMRQHKFKAEHEALHAKAEADYKAAAAAHVLTAEELWIPMAGRSGRIRKPKKA